MASVSTSIDIGTAPDRVREGTTFRRRLEVAGTPSDVDRTATALPEA